MEKQHILVWTGGQDRQVQQCQPMVEALPFFPEPVPLLQLALIEYHWGETKFHIVATACSLRTTAWGDEQVTWLHCKAKEVSAIQFDGTTSFTNVLIPAHYVTHLGPGPSFRILRGRHSNDLGVFPPIQPAPANALVLEQIERGIAELLTPERN